MSSPFNHQKTKLANHPQDACRIPAYLEKITSMHLRKQKFYSAWEASKYLHLTCVLCVGMKHSLAIGTHHGVEILEGSNVRWQFINAKVSYSWKKEHSLAMHWRWDAVISKGSYVETGKSAVYLLNALESKVLGCRMQSETERKEEAAGMLRLARAWCTR